MLPTVKEEFVTQLAANGQSRGFTITLYKLGLYSVVQDSFLLVRRG